MSSTPSSMVMGTPTRVGRLSALAQVAAGVLTGSAGYALSSSFHTASALHGPTLLGLGAAATLALAWRLASAPQPHPSHHAAPQAGPPAARPSPGPAATMPADLLHAAFEHAASAMVITDAQDRIVAINPAFAALTGRTAQELAGQPAELMGMAPLRGTHLPGIDAALREGGRWSGESALQAADGRSHDVWMAVSTLRDDKCRTRHHCRVFQDVGPLKEQLRAMAEQARHDSLTGLPNRRAFGEMLFRAMARTRRHPCTLAIMCVDLDGFKAVNDGCGHQVGDELLVHVARRLLACVRTTDAVCRMGGDEFMLILEGAGSATEVRSIGQRVLTCLTEPYTIEGHHLRVTPSIGAVIHDGRESDATLVQRADAAMYVAKNAGKCRMVLDEEPGGASHPREDAAQAA